MAKQVVRSITSKAKPVARESNQVQNSQVEAWNSVIDIDLEKPKEYNFPTGKFMEKVDARLRRMISRLLGE